MESLQWFTKAIVSVLTKDRTVIICFVCKALVISNEKVNNKTIDNIQIQIEYSHKR